IFVRGSSNDASLVWNASNQLRKDTQLQLLSSDKGSASLNLNGFHETIARLTLAAGAKVLTDGPHGGGVLTVSELSYNGKNLPKGVYTSSEEWLHGRGHVIVGDIKQVDVSGVIDDPNRTIGAGNIAVLKSASTFRLPGDECSVAAIT